jgi:hypothetical protein
MGIDEYVVGLFTVVLVLAAVVLAILVVVFREQ